ncbi:MAG: methyltransferase [Halioglobus sp.]
MKLITTLALACSLALPAITLADNHGDDLATILSQRSAEDQARDAARHPAQTLEFFQVQPGMTVAEALPGSGWYTKILASYLGPKGTLYGVNYVDRLWPLFGLFTDEQIDGRIAATGKFPQQVRDFTDNGIKAEGFTFGTVPSDVSGTVDRFLLIRALHNLNRFEKDAGTLSQALAAVRAMLKEDGLVGVVQHRLPEGAPLEGSDGSRGYLKQSHVIKVFEDAGFELVAKSEINANSKDRPDATDIVWRLPPSYSGSAGDPAAKLAMTAIGESDRMTLLFKKVQ